MPKKKECVEVSNRRPRLRHDTPFMKAHETMVDFIKGNVSMMDIIGAGFMGFLQNLELDEERDLYYSDDDDDEDFGQHFETLKPHPRIKELDDEEADKQIKDSIAEEEKRRSKSVQNKRKKMRKKEKKRQEREEGDKKVVPKEEKEKLSSSESEEERKNISYKESDKPVLKLSNEQHNSENSIEINQEENPVQLNKKKAEPPTKNMDSKSSSPCISDKKTNNKSEENEETLAKPNKTAETPTRQNKMAETPTKQNKTAEKNKVKKPKKQEEPNKKKCDKVVKENGDTVTTIQKEHKEEESVKESVEPIVEECVKKSREMAAIGNRLAANGQYEMAIKCFTEAIKYTPKEYKIFGNRSFCFEKLQQFEAALSDAEICLSLEPTWTKGLFRKGKALCGLKKYNDASLAFTEVLKIESTSQEAALELKRAQTLHLMEMGFTWAQCTDALKNHTTLEEAIDALFTEELESSPLENGACKFDPSTASANKEWERVGLSTKPKQPNKEKIELQYPLSKKQNYPGKLFPVWVGSLASTVDYTTLHEVFSRVGKVFSIKMVLEHQCAFVNYTSKTDCDRAIQLLNGFLLQGSPLSVRYPSRLPPGLCASKHAETDPRTPPCIQKECFFWRTCGCTKDECTYKHIPKNRGIDQGKFSIKGFNS